MKQLYLKNKNMSKFKQKVYGRRKKSSSRRSQLTVYSCSHLSIKTEEIKILSFGLACKKPSLDSVSNTIKKDFRFLKKLNCFNKKELKIIIHIVRQKLGKQVLHSFTDTSNFFYWY
jgi:hypothetical protein